MTSGVGCNNTTKLQTLSNIASAGHHHGAAYADGPHLYIWGSNAQGQLGIGGPHAQLVALHPFQQAPHPVSQPTSPHTFRGFRNGDSNSSSGSPPQSPGQPSPVLWGSKQGPAGRSPSPPPPAGGLPQPPPAAAAAGAPAAQPPGKGVRARRGRKQNLQGAVMAWIQPEPEPDPPPVIRYLSVYRLPLGQPILAVACGATHTLALLQPGGVVAWGDNRHGQCGLVQGRHPSVPSPTRIPAFEGVAVTVLAAGENHCAALATAGKLWTWGDNRCLPGNFF